MTTHLVTDLLADWEQQAATQRELVSLPVSLSRDDCAKIAALSEIYQLDQEQLIANILHNALLEIEEAMPYKAGKTIIRMEEGDPIYEDVGPTSAYLAAKRRIQEV